MTNKTITVEDIGTYYATENAQLPSIMCPECNSVTPLTKLVSEKECENCSTKIELKIETEQQNK
jgi:DNA-directed RNA polymerase subunit RPC12/RpoP